LEQAEKVTGVKQRWLLNLLERRNSGYFNHLKE
jgi:hypothetical protein